METIVRGQRKRYEMCTMRRMTVLVCHEVSIIIMFHFVLRRAVQARDPSGDELPTKVLNITSHDTAAS